MRMIGSETVLRHMSLTYLQPRIMKYSEPANGLLI